MSVRLYAFTCGWVTLPLRMMLEGADGSLRVPVPSFLIDHPDGRVLFDSGLSLAAQADAEGYLGGAARFMQLDFGAGEDIATRLAGADIDPASIDYLVLSHLHFDHAGGTSQITNAQTILQDREWGHAASLDSPHAHGYHPEDFDVGQDVRRIDGECDVFGDGRVVCLPTYGHTPGHQSLRVRTDEAEIVLAADACYLRQTLADMHLPGVCHDRDAMRASLEALRRLAAGGAHIVYGHDPEYWADMPQASAPFSGG